jgi:hypothetical protein
MSESSPVGTAFNVPSALDRDTAQYGVQSYELRDVTGRATNRWRHSGVTVARQDEDVCSTPHFELKVLCDDDR